jgi:N-methylhydantoinase A
VQTLYTAAGSPDARALEAAFVTLEKAGAAMLDRAGIPSQRRRFERAVDARYARQSYELSVPVAARPVEEAALAQVIEDFHQRHRKTYGHDNRSEPVQIISVRLSAIGMLPSLTIRSEPAHSGTQARKGEREVWFRESGAVAANVYERAQMPAQMQAAGPTVIESLESTILVPPGWDAKMNADGFVLLARGHAESRE